jgi:hypothetical protein
MEQERVIPDLDGFAFPLRERVGKVFLAHPAPRANGVLKNVDLHE